MKITIQQGKIGGKPIIKAWESFTGWYWLAVEKSHTQDSLINGKVYKDDTIWFGFVIGTDPEWGYFSQSEIELLSPKVWELSKQAISWLSKTIQNNLKSDIH